MESNNYQGYLQNNTIFKVLIEESVSPVGLYVGRDMVIKLANKAILKVWDKSEAVIGKTFREALPELEGQPFFQLLDDVYTTGIAYEAHGEKVDLFVDGRMQTYYFNFTYQPLKNEQGEVWGIMNTASDVTELVLTRQKLADNQERTRFALGSAELGTWDLDPVNDIVTWDAKCKQLYGFPDGEEVLSYKEVLKYIHPEDKERIDKTVQDSLIPPQGGFYESEFRTIGAGDGVIRWLRCRGKAYFNEAGRCIRFAGTALDITSEIKDKEEQRKLLTLIDHSSDFVSLSDIDSNVYYVNAAGREMLGMDADAPVFLPSIDFIVPEEISRVKDHIYKAIEKGGRWSGEVIYRHFKTGEPIPVHGTSMRIYDPITGQPQGRATVSRDLRREIADRQALINSQQLLLNITSAAPAALWMSDETGMITYANQTWTTWTGQPNEEVLGTGWLEAILPEDRIRAAEKFLNDLEERRPYEVDFRLLFKDGSVHWCIATGNPQYNESGVFVGYIGACTDVTEKKVIDIELEQSNAELNAQIKQFEFVTDFMPVQLWTAKTTGELDYLNKRAIDFLGLPEGDIIGPNWLEQVHPDDRDACVKTWVSSLESGNLYQFEFRLRDKDGNYRWHLSRALPFMSDGIILKWFGTNTDIHEQKELQRQKDDFLGIASHELKTPVTSIKAYAQVLGAMFVKEGDAKKAAMVEKMDSQLNRLTNLIGDLLDVTKINSGKIQFNKTWFDFNDVVRDNVQDLQHTTNKHTLEMDFAETGEVYSDKDRIGQVITNLITNAIKYSPHSDRIIISTKIEGADAVVRVQDFGIGIPDDKKDRVFEQFYRVSGSKQHTFPGLGLGLYISSEIIKREGGKMWVNSVEGKGSTFCFSLPVDGQNITATK
ncbi:PAS domain-containing protein [Mucilaginibacter psychrotolerans]|uniref:histidine kinase n=1 Tax=Mucilaginibacter psychrotolerans TaxID=1524096 RepID=A0A4Y8RXL4_9SPHI|nr:PAS domain-containing protein [Mucilaginibacter psychrotolerans]TFF30416.1 PAS domain S-box protein [Mucilaginibacter psychrotolerans]